VHCLTVEFKEHLWLWRSHRTGVNVIDSHTAVVGWVPAESVYDRWC